LSNFLKATAVRDTVLTALSRMLVLAPTVWRDAGGSFRGVAGDTITVRIPAYTEADSRDLRSGASRTRRGLFESKVDIVLDTNLYRDVPLTDPNQTLDIMNFTTQVLNPILAGVARGIENVLVDDAIEGATYDLTQDFDPDAPFASVVGARKQLNLANVPAEGRTLAVGADIAEALLSSDQFARVDASGTSQSLREGVIGRIAGMPTVESNAIAPDKAYAYHRTAYALALQAPIVPNGAASGFTASEDGFAIRVIEALESSSLDDIVAADVFVGAAEVTDAGILDDDGVFTPTENPDDSSSAVAGDDLFVRAVELTLTS
jgi:hypothetical protein